MQNFSSMNLQQLLEHFKEAREIDSGFIIDFTKRLIEITYFERDVSVGDREKGEGLINAVIPEFEKFFEPYPEGLGAYRKAYQYQLNNVKYHGYGSLAWKIREPGISGEEVINIIIEPSSGPLIADYLTTMTTEDWVQIKPAVLKALILDRKRSGENNTVLILSGLVSGCDLVAWNILAEDEREKLLNVAKDYTAARKILVEHKLLPEESGAAPLTPAPEPQFIKSLVILEMREPFDLVTVSELKKGYDILNDDQKDFLSLILKSLSLKLWLDVLDGTYGGGLRSKVEKEVMGVFKQATKEGFESLLNTLTVADNYRARDSYYGPDYSIAVAFSDWYIHQQANEDEKLRLMQTISNIINYARVNALHRFRFTLRYFAKYPPGRHGPDEEILRYIKEKYGEMYALFGSRLHEAEQELLSEDWIGFWNP